VKRTFRLLDDPKTPEMIEVETMLGDCVAKITEFHASALNYWIAAEKIANRGNGVLFQRTHGDGGMIYWFGPPDQPPPADGDRVLSCGMSTGVTITFAV
jgi:hypothetical protein